jgi:hypothetical protein
MDTKFCAKLGKTPTETYEMLQIACGSEAWSSRSVFESFKLFKNGWEDYLNIQEAGFLQPLEMRTQSQMSVKCRHEIVDGLFEWWRMN